MSRFFNGLRERLKSKLIHNAFLFAVNHSQARVLKEFVGKTRPRQEVVWNEAEFEHVCNFMTLAAVPGASAFGSFTNNNAVSISLSLRDHCGPPNPAELAKQYVHISTHLVFPELLFIHAHTHTHIIIINARSDYSRAQIKPQKQNNQQHHPKFMKDIVLINIHKTHLGFSLWVIFSPSY